MPDSFYQALIVFLPLAALVLLAVRRAHPAMEKKVRADIEHRLFAESPTFVVEDLTLDKSPGGFYTFRVEGLVAGVSDEGLEVRIVEGTHSGTDFLRWDYLQPKDIDLQPQYQDFYCKA